MRLISIILFLLSVSPVFARDASEQVIVNGRVTTYGSVVEDCGGDTLLAASRCRPLPVDVSYMTRSRIAAETLYNTLKLPVWPVILAAAGAVMLIITRRRGNLRRQAVVPALLAGVMCYAMSWWFGGWFPLMTATDTLSAIGLLLCVVLLCVRNRAAIALGLAVAALLWGVAYATGSHPAVRPLNPSLLTVWLPVHVSLMMAAYTLFLLSAVIATVSPVGKRTRNVVLAGVALLAAGIVTGGLWAMGAWGRFWAWDPKETWALITAVAYITVLAVWRPAARRQPVLRLTLIVVFAMVVFTWWGTSRLGGLHAY